MILQEIGDRQFVYMPDIDAGHIVLGESMGLCDIHGKTEMHAVIAKIKYVTDCGVSVDAWRMTGQTVDVTVLPSRVRIKGPTAVEMSEAFNSFNRPVYKFGRYTFVGKFKAPDSIYTFTDRTGRRITTGNETVKDITGIYNLMVNLGANNGAIFQPVIARYMWAIWHMRGRPSKYQPVGYFDLEDYLQVMRDERRSMFSRTYNTAAITITLGKNPYVNITGVDGATGQAVLEMEDATVIDREKDRTFKPFVLVANRPFELRQELQFRWTKVDFQGNSVFLMPVMNMAGTWKSMKNMINLLSTTQL